VPTLIRAASVLTVLLASSLALAQTAAQTGILAQGRFCLDVGGRHTASRPPPLGARVVATPCSGQPSQRWTKLSGDYNRIDSIGGRRLSVGPSRRNDGRAPVVLRDRWPEIDLVGTQLRTGDRCVTRRGREVWLEACRAGDPAQRWELR